MLLLRLLAMVVGVTSFAFIVTIVVTIFDRTYRAPSWLGPAVIGVASGMFALVTITSKSRNDDAKNDETQPRV